MEEVMNNSLKIDDYEVKLKSFIFSGGEIQVRVEPPSSYGFPRHARAAQIRADIRSANDLMETILLTDAVRRIYPSLDIELLCPYLPYARQDRVCYPGESLAIKVLCDMINAQKYSKVVVWDAHSQVSLALLDRVVNVEASELIGSIITSNDFLVSPDAGAIKRVSQCAKAFNRPLIQAEKTRSTATGEITGTVVHCDHIGNNDFLILDDLIDGGLTFIKLAEKLKSLTNGKIRLYATHGIFSKGFDVFKGLIDEIYVANTFVKELPDFVKVV